MGLKIGEILGITINFSAKLIIDFKFELLIINL